MYYCGTKLRNQAIQNIPRLTYEITLSHTKASLFKQKLIFPLSFGDKHLPKNCHRIVFVEIAQEIFN